MVRPVEKLHPERDAVMQWHTQAGNITTNLKIRVDFTVRLTNWDYQAKGPTYPLEGTNTHCHIPRGT